MATQLYKTFFEVRLFHQSAPAKLCQAVSLQPTLACKELMANYHMQWRGAPGKVSVFYSGPVVADGAPPAKKITPAPQVVPDGTAFLFTITSINNSFAASTTLPTESTASATDKNIPLPYPFIKSAVVAIAFAKTAATKPVETFQVLNSNNSVVYEALVKMNEAGLYHASADLRLQPPGTYTFGLQGDGSVRKTFYVDTLSEVAGTLGLFRVVKEAGWLLPDKISPPPSLPDYNIISYTFPTL